MATGVRTQYHVAIDSKGFMLRSSQHTRRPAYEKVRAPTQVNQLGVGDLNYNQLNGSGWSYWSQVDWSGGFQVVKFKDDASFRDGQAVEVLKQYGQVTLQPGWTSAFMVSGAYATVGSHAINNGNMLLGMSQAQVSGRTKILKVTSANVVSTVSAMVGIYKANGMDRFKDNTIIGMSRTSGVSAKTMAKYTGSVLSGFRKANPIVRDVHTVGIRLYSSERVSSLSGDVLFYATNLSAFTSAYQAGKNRTIEHIDDINGAPYFFVADGKSLELFSWDETNALAYPVYSWDNLTNFSIKQYLSSLIITGKSNNKTVAYSFNGARVAEIFDDQLRDATYDVTNSFEFEGNLQTKSMSYDGTVWVPGMYGQLTDSLRFSPFINFANKAYGNVTSGSKNYFGYRDTTKYAISGNIVSSEFGANVGAIDKLVNSVSINMKPLAIGEMIEVFQSIDGAATFTSIGKASHLQDGAIKSKTLYFPSGFTTKLWNYKVQLVGSGSSAPTLTAPTFQYRPFPDLKKEWLLSLDAGDDIFLLNKSLEKRDAKLLMQDLWLGMEAKKTVIYEDLDAFEVTLVSAMSDTATSAITKNGRLVPTRGRIRARKNGVIEEMKYTSADGGIIKGITRGVQSTLPQSYVSGDKLDNYYNVVMTSIIELVSDTDQNKTESIARVTLLEV